jgi:predicted DNA-binding transcriptional regulator YafY
VPADYEPGEKFLRVFQLFTRLTDTDAGLTTAQLAAELEVTTRTVQRYIATLRDSAGIDIEESGGRFRIGAGTRLPPLQFDRYQATLLLVALRLLHQLRTEQDPAMVGALAQLSRALRVPLVVRYLQRMLASAESRHANPERQHVERVVIDGFATLQAIEVDYVDSKGAQSRRTLRPYFIEPQAEGRHIYVLAHDASSGMVRTFRLDRIRTARLLPETFSVPDGFDIDDTLSDSWSVWQGDTPDDVVLRFVPEAAQWVRETPWHHSATITGRDDGTTEVRLRVASEMEMRPTVLRWTPYVVVVAPESLRAYVAAALQQAARLYSVSNGGAAGTTTAPRRRR